MSVPTLLVRAKVPGPGVTGNPVSTGTEARAAYRRRIHRALRNAPFAKPVPDDGPLAVRIEVIRRPRSAGDADNIAKPILDALEPVVGTKSGRVRDCRVHRLEVVIREVKDEDPMVIIEIHRIVLPALRLAKAS